MVGEEAKQIALTKAGEMQRRLGRRVTIQEAVKVALQLLDVEAAVNLLKEEEKK
jgi:hypothetical protein